MRDITTRRPQPVVETIAVPLDEWHALQARRAHRVPEAPQHGLRPGTRALLWIVAIVGVVLLVLAGLKTWQEHIRASVEIARAEAEVAMAQAQATSSDFNFDGGPAMVILITLAVVALICMIVR